MVKLKVKPASGARFEVDVDVQSSVSSLKEQLASPSGIAADEQRVIYRGQVLKDERTLSSYGIEEDHTVHLVPRAPAAQRGTGAPSAQPQHGSVQSEHGQQQSVNGTPGLAGLLGAQQQQQQQQGSAPTAGLASLLGTGGANAGGSNGGFLESLLGDGSQGQSMQQMMQQMHSNPQQMQEMLNSPFMQTLLQQVENDPEMLRTMAEQSPGLSEQMSQENPELYHMMRDPNTVRQMVQMMRNPGLMQEEMRAADRAMSNLETNPEGYQMLRRMHESMNDSMRNAESATDDGNSGETSREPQAQGGTGESDGSPNTRPLPNPWSSGQQGSVTGGGVNSMLSSGTGQNPAGTNAGLASLLSGINGGGAGGGQSHGAPGADPLGMGADPSQALNQMQQVMNNPQMRQAIDQIVSNPEMLESMLRADPRLQQVMEQNPQMAQVLRDPNMLRQAIDPQNLQALSQMEQAMQQLTGSGMLGGNPLGQMMQQQQQQQSSQQGQAGGEQQPDLNQLLGMLGGSASAQGNSVQQQQSQQPPEERFATQLQQLREMGFLSDEENVRALEVRYIGG